ncbi:MAG: hypothetical protein ABH880_02260 [Patescibacteria group bacterium]
MRYEVWHDEYKGDDKVNEYWHGLWFVPEKYNRTIISSLQAIRDEHGVDYSASVKFAGCLKKPATSRLISNQLQLFSHSLIRKPEMAETPLINQDQGNKFRQELDYYYKLNSPWFCKFVLLKIPDNHANMNTLIPDYADRVETTYRWALKGGLHFLLKDQPVEIVAFHFDGDQHHGRPISKDNITRGPFRGNITFSKDLRICSYHKKNRPTGENMMLCLVDNALGAIASNINGVTKIGDATYPLEEIMKRAWSGTLNKQVNSRWYKSINFSQAEIINGEIRFFDIFKKIADVKQGELSFFL